jgi:hypothetical protein
VQPQSTVLLEGSATLRGSGIVGDIALGTGSPTIAPSQGPPTLSCANFNPLVGGAGTLTMALNGSGSGRGYSELDVRGTVNLAGVTLNASLNFPAVQNERFIIIRNHGGNPVKGAFTGLPQDATLTIGGALLQITYTGGLGFPIGHDVVLTQVSAATAALAPALTIERAALASVRLLWPTNAAGFTLQSNPGLTKTNWVAVSPPPAVVGTNNVVTNTAGGAQTLYRLSKP